MTESEQPSAKTNIKNPALPTSSLKTTKQTATPKPQNQGLHFASWIVNKTTTSLATAKDNSKFNLNDPNNLSEEILKFIFSTTKLFISFATLPFALFVAFIEKIVDLIRAPKNKSTDEIETLEKTSEKTKQLTVNHEEKDNQETTETLNENQQTNQQAQQKNIADTVTEKMNENKKDLTDAATAEEMADEIFRESLPQANKPTESEIIIDEENTEANNQAEPLADLESAETNSLMQESLASGAPSMGSGASPG